MLNRGAVNSNESTLASADCGWLPGTTSIGIRGPLRDRSSRCQSSASTASNLLLKLIASRARPTDGKKPCSAARPESRQPDTNSRQPSIKAHFDRLRASLGHVCYSYHDGCSRRAGFRSCPQGRIRQRCGHGDTPVWSPWGSAPMGTTPGYRRSLTEKTCSTTAGMAQARLRLPNRERAESCPCHVQALNHGGARPPASVIGKWSGSCLSRGGRNCRCG